MTDYLDEKIFGDQILEILYQDRIDIREVTDRTKSNES